MGHKATNATKRTGTSHNSYDKPIPKPPAELLESFFSRLNEQFVTRRFSKTQEAARTGSAARTQNRGS